MAKDCELCGGDEVLPVVGDELGVEGELPCPCVADAEKEERERREFQAKLFDAMKRAGAQEIDLP